MVAKAGMRIGDHSWDHPVDPGARGPQSGTRGRGDREDRRRARIARGRVEVVPPARRQLRRGGAAGSGASTDARRHVERGSSGLELAHVVEADHASRARRRGSRFDRADARRRGRPERDDPRAPEDHPRHPEDGPPSGRAPEAGVTPWGEGTDVWARNARDRGMSEELSAAERARRNERQRRRSTPRKRRSTTRSRTRPNAGSSVRSTGGGHAHGRTGTRSRSRSVPA